VKVVVCYRHTINFDDDNDDDDDDDDDNEQYYIEIYLFYLFIFNRRFKAHDTMTSNTAQHRYNTYVYKSLRQNTTPPFQKR